MGTVTNFLLCSFVVLVTQGELSFKEDRPFLRVPLKDQADLECCYDQSNNDTTVTWVKHVNNLQNTSIVVKVEPSQFANISTKSFDITTCSVLTLRSVRLEDSGMYSCGVNNNGTFLYSYGTYLQVYRKLRKTIDVSESTKDKILKAEGILLFLSVVLPAVTLLFQSKKLSQLEKKKVKREEENIYQGLNLDQTSPTYDQIERSQAPDPYQDVYNMIQENEEIQLEKP